MNLKNYTSNVPVARTISRIEQMLAEAGASGIHKEYVNGALIALAFSINLPVGRLMTIRLPANQSAVYLTMKKSILRPRKGTLDKLNEQAARTAWKLMQDWVEVQLSLIKMQQVDVLQVFLPYVWDGKRTFYESLKDHNYIALTETTE